MIKKIILIFDEIITGVRTEKGSVQNKFNIYPDITLAGKIIGGGLPMSLILTNKKINEKIMKLKKKIFLVVHFQETITLFYHVSTHLNILKRIMN